ncbi:MAG: DUF4954 family protein [Planctomycetota bacterium]
MIRVDPVAEVTKAREASEAVRVLEAARVAAGGHEALRPADVRALEAQGNTCADWSRVTVAPGFDPSYVRGTSFAGDCRLGRFGQPVAITHGVSFPSGVYGSTVVDATVADGALVKNVRLLARAYVGEGAVAFDVGELAGRTGTSFACGRAVPVGIEAGGREVALYPEITVAVAARVALDRADERLQSAYMEAVEHYVEALSSDVSILGAGARVLHVGALRGVLVGAGAVVDGALEVEDACILSADDDATRIGAGAIVVHSILQWGARATTGAVIDSSALLEHASAIKGAKVTGCILGPCSLIEKGEATSTLVGPLVMQRHQSLLIAAVWPGGRGSVAAGALVGANHTGRTGDQEIRVGEGVFFGLGSRVKLPTDLSRAPYTIVTGNVPLPPQGIDFPFSLVRGASAALARDAQAVAPRPVTHEILPGWVLAESPFTLVRAAWKHRGRYTARRQPLGHEPTPDPLRPEILALVQDARDRLLSAAAGGLHTSADISGLGACVMTEAARREAGAAYAFTLVHRSLLGLWARLRVCHSLDDVCEAVDGEEPDAAWAFHRAVLVEERPGAHVRTLLEELLDMQERFADAVESSKRKDDSRGARVIEDYADAHVPASEDPHVRRVREATASLEADVTHLLERIPVKATGLASRKGGRQ